MPPLLRRLSVQAACKGSGAGPSRLGVLARAKCLVGWLVLGPRRQRVSLGTVWGGGVGGGARSLDGPQLVSDTWGEKGGAYMLLLISRQLWPWPGLAQGLGPELHHQGNRGVGVGTAGSLMCCLFSASPTCELRTAGRQAVTPQGHTSHVPHAED